MYKCEYIGIDLLDSTSNNSNTKPDFFASGEELPFRNNIFDFVTCYSVVPYVENIDKFFDEMFRVMTPNSIAVIIIMNLRGLALQSQTHFENRFNSRQLQKKLKEHGFKSIKFRNLKTLFYSTYFDLTSVYAYAIVTPEKGSE